MKHKIFKWLFFSGIIITTCIGVYTLITYPNTQKKQVKFLIKIKGAIHYPGEYFVLENSLLIDLLYDTKIKENADLTKIDLNKKITKNETINIEENILNNKKIIFKNIEDIKELLNLKIPRILANKIWEYKQNNINYSWVKVQEIKGIGEKILQYLKNHIIM